MSNPDTWMPLYVSRYLGDTGHLTVGEHGAYLLLLMQYWIRGPLPDDDVKLAKMAQTDLKAWRKGIGQTIREFFTVRDGALHQKRADMELAKAGEIIQKKRAAANTRWGGGKAPPPTKPNGHDADDPAHADGMQVHSTSISDAEHPQSISNPDAMHQQCPLPVPSKKDSSLTLEESLYPGAPAPTREVAAPVEAETRREPPTAEEIAAVEATVANLTASLTMRKSAPGKWQRLSEAEQRAVAETLPRFTARPLSPEQLAIVRRRAGIGPAIPDRSQLRVVR